MTSVILKSIGLDTVDPAIILITLLVLILILFILVILQSSKLSKLTKKYDKFMNGRDGDSMEDEIISLFEDIRLLKRNQKKDAEDIAAIKRNLLNAYQKVGVVRYDAFREMGGKLSFSIALLNDKDNGFIINSVHSSDGCYTYAKEIVGGESYIQLGSEEREALNKALDADNHGILEAEINAGSILKKPEKKSYNSEIKRRVKSSQKAPENIRVEIESVDQVKYDPTVLNDEDYLDSDYSDNNYDDLDFEEF